MARNDHNSDVDGNGMINIREFYHAFNIQPTPFGDEVFRVFDLDQSGEEEGSVDFEEFFLSMYKFLTLTKPQMVRWVFDMFDTDHSGDLNLYEMDRMTKTFFGGSTIDSKVTKFMRTLDKDVDPLRPHAHRPHDLRTPRLALHPEQSSQVVFSFLDQIYRFCPESVYPEATNTFS